MACPKCGERAEIPAHEFFVQNDRQSVGFADLATWVAEHGVEYVEPVSASGSGDGIWEVGSVVEGKYEVRDAVQGGMAMVYICRHREWNIDIAVKTARPADSASGPSEWDPAVIEHEAQSWIELGVHPNIVTCYYVRRIGDTPYLFLEYVGGGDLRQWINAVRPTTDLAAHLDVAIQVCDGMAHAHRKGMIHCDLKPGNVLLTPDGVAKVTDFGLMRRGTALAEDEETSHEELALYAGLGTKAYMPPEQFEEPDLGPSADIYSFGIVLFEILAGRRPFIATPPEGWEDWTPQQKTIWFWDFYRRCHLHQEPPDLAQLAPKAPQGLIDLVVRGCLAKEPGKRIDSFDAVRDELCRIYQEASGKEFPRSKPEDVGLLADSLNNQAVSLADLGKEEAALKLWNEALGANPRHVESVYNRGLLLWRSGKVSYQQVSRHFSEIAAAKGESWVGRYLLGWLGTEGGDHEAAVSDLTEAAKLAPGRQEVARALASAQLQRDRSSECALLLGGHEDAVSCVAFTPDSRRALSGSWDSTLRLWDAETGKCLHVLTDHEAPVSCLSVAPDGRWAVSGDSGGEIKIWDLTAGRCVRGARVEADSIHCTAVSPDGRSIMVGDSDGQVTQWDPASGECVRAIPAHQGAVSCISIGPDGQQALSGSRDGRLILWDLSSFEAVGSFGGYAGPVIHASIGPDGTWGLSGTGTQGLTQWDLEAVERLVQVEIRKGMFTAAGLSPDGRWVLAGSSSGKLELHEMATGRYVMGLKGHLASVECVAISPNGLVALSGGQDKMLRMWRLDGSTVRAPFTLTIQHSPTDLVERAMDLQRAMDGARAVLDSNRPKDACSTLRHAWHLAEEQRNPDFLSLWWEIGRGARRCGLRQAWFAREFTGPGNAASCLGVSSDGCSALSGRSDGTLVLWELATGRRTHKLVRHKGNVAALDISLDGQYAVSGGADSALKLWELQAGRPAREFAGHARWVTCCAFDPEGGLVVSGSKDRTVRVYDCHNGKRMAQLTGHRGDVVCVATTPDGTHAISGSSDKTVRVWDIHKGRCVQVLDDHGGGVLCLAVLPDELRVLSGCADGTLRLWDITTGDCLMAMEGLSGAVECVAITCDGRFALSGGRDRLVRVWDLATGECVAKLGGHKTGLIHVSVSADGRWAFSASKDDTVRMWELTWDYEFPEPADWDDGAFPYLEVFLARHASSQRKGILGRSAGARDGAALWSEQDFEELLATLRNAGYGWLRPEGVRKTLAEMVEHG